MLYGAVPHHHIIHLLKLFRCWCALIKVQINTINFAKKRGPAAVVAVLDLAHDDAALLQEPRDTRHSHEAWERHREEDDTETVLD